MTKRSAAQLKADANFESKRVDLCDARGSKAEQEAFRAACKVLGITQREALKLIVKIAADKA